MTKHSCQRVFRLASIFLCLHLIPYVASGKCSGKWSLQACMGGNGKRSGDSRPTGTGVDNADSLFLRRLLLPTKFPAGYDSLSLEDAPTSEDRWPVNANERESYGEASKEGVMLELLDILGQMEKARELRRQAEQYQDTS